MKKSLITPLFAAVTIIFTTVCSSSCTYEEPVLVIEGGEVPEEPVSVPSQDEADAAAAETIDAENADEKLDDLLESIDG